VLVGTNTTSQQDDKFKIQVTPRGYVMIALMNVESRTMRLLFTTTDLSGGGPDVCEEEVKSEELDSCLTSLVRLFATYLIRASFKSSLLSVAAPAHLKSNKIPLVIISIYLSICSSVSFSIQYPNIL